MRPLSIHFLHVGSNLNGNLSELVGQLRSTLEIHLFMVFYAEIDGLSYASATANISNNNFSDRIQVFKTTLDDPLLVPLSKYPDSK